MLLMESRMASVESHENERKRYPQDDVIAPSMREPATDAERCKRPEIATDAAP